MAGTFLSFNLTQELAKNVDISQFIPNITKVFGINPIHEGELRKLAI